MSQNDFTIANQGFPAFRADLNSALQALASNSSGTSAPSTTFANMWWYDSANNIMYIRNEDNDAWIKFAELDQTNDKFVLSGTLQLDDGTVSAPALTFNSDTNMGIYRGGTDILKFVTAGTDAITIDASQGVTLAGKLDVSSGTIKLDGNYPTGTDNVALGNTALDDGSLSGDYNTAIGAGSLTANTSGVRNTACGQGSLASNTTGERNTAVGRSALYSSTGSYNTAVGMDALVSNTSASNNTAVGQSALASNTTASNNTAVGQQAGYSNTTGTSNVFFGRAAGFSNTTGSENTAVGRLVLFDNTTGANNTALGRSALENNTTASSNTAVGYQSGYSVTTGISNTFVGKDAGRNQTTSNGSTFIGADAGYYVTTGAKNTIIGAYNGNQGGLDIRTSSNRIVLSDGDGNPRFLVDNNGNFMFSPNLYSTADAKIVTTHDGNSQVGFTIRSTSDINQSEKQIQFKKNNASSIVEVGTITSNRTSTSYNTSSDHRLKENVTADWDATTRLKQLNPVRFNFIADADTIVDGFLAHEVQSVVPEAITGTHNEVDDDGNPVYQGIDQSKLVPLLVKTIQELEARIATLEGA
jgi:hypothetical protein